MYKKYYNYLDSLLIYDEFFKDNISQDRQIQILSDVINLRPSRHKELQLIGLFLESAQQMPRNRKANV